MSIGEPIVFVSCDGDGCTVSDEFSLTTLAQHSWDMRNLKSQLKSAGWTTDGDRHFCDTCMDEQRTREERASE